MQNLGEDLSVAADVRGRIRRHPLLATGLAAFAGVVAGPFILRGFKRKLTTSGASNPPARRSFALPGLVMASLHALRAR